MLSLSTKIIAVALGLGFATPLYATEIINNISTSASTGGNSANSGEVIQGESKAEVKIYTEVNGEVINDIDETITAPPGEDAVINKSVEVNLPSVQSVVTVETEAETKTGQSRALTSSLTSSTTTTVEVEKTNPVIALFNKIFNYVFTIFSIFNA